MKYSKEIINKREYLKIEIIEINQKGKIFFVSKVLYEDLSKIYTIEPTKYDDGLYGELEDTSNELLQYYEVITQKDDEDIQLQGYQRLEEEDRVRDIKKFVNESEFPIFPNTIILTCDLGVDILDVEDGVSVREYIGKDSGRLSFVEKANNNLYLYVPFEEDSLVVVDGQHRLAGLRESDIGEEPYELLVSFIIGYDRTYVANLFYTINSTQKKVNKSVLLHLQAEFSRKLDKNTFIHGIVRILNEHIQSPLNNRIKMLGVVPEGVEAEERYRYGVSQAFLIDYMMPLIGGEPSRGNYQPVFNYYYENKEYHGDLIKFVIMYFNAIRRHTKHYWDNPRDSIITKTISIGAFIKILHFIMIKIFVDEWDCDPSKISEVTTDFLQEKLQGIENIDFSKAGAFGGVSSAGTLGKLQKLICENIDYLNVDTYEEFIANQKENYYPRFKDWFLSNKSGGVYDSQ